MSVPSGEVTEEKKRRESISFKPVTQGLGFHPFSDGMPYAPMSKTQRSSGPMPAAPTPRAPVPSSGTGAVSAGLPQFAFPQTRVETRPQAPMARFTAMPAPQAAAQAPTAEAVGISVASDGQTYSFFYAVKRSMAFLLDSILNLALCAAAFSFVLWKLDAQPSQLVAPEMLTFVLLFLAFFNWAIIVAQEIAFGTTIGKHLVGLSLDGPPAAVFLRSFFFWVSVGFGGLGLIWALFDRQHRCWHDLIVNLQPQENASL